MKYELLFGNPVTKTVEVKARGYLEALRLARRHPEKPKGCKAVEAKRIPLYTKITDAKLGTCSWETAKEKPPEKKESEENVSGETSSEATDTKQPEPPSTVAKTEEKPTSNALSFRKFISK